MYYITTRNIIALITYPTILASIIIMSAKAYHVLHVLHVEHSMKNAHPMRTGLLDSHGKNEEGQFIFRVPCHSESECKAFPQVHL